MFLNRGDRDKNNATSLKEGRVIEIETTVLSITRCSLLSLCHRNVNYSAFHIRDARSLRHRNVNYSASHIRDARSLSLFVFYLPVKGDFPPFGSTPFK